MHKLLFVLVFLSFVGATSVVKGEVIACEAQVALNEQYNVSLDNLSNTMKVTNRAGSIYSGQATYWKSSRTMNHSYILHYTYDLALRLEINHTNSDDIFLCLKANECYQCSPTN